MKDTAQTATTGLLKTKAKEVICTKTGIPHYTVEVSLDLMFALPRAAAPNPAASNWHRAAPPPPAGGPMGATRCRSEHARPSPRGPAALAWRADKGGRQPRPRGPAPDLIVRLHSCRCAALVYIDDGAIPGQNQDAPAQNLRHAGPQSGQLQRRPTAALAQRSCGHDGRIRDARYAAGKVALVPGVGGRRRCVQHARVLRVVCPRTF